MRLVRRRSRGAALLLLIAPTVLLVLPPTAAFASDEPPESPAPVKVEDPPAKPADAEEAEDAPALSIDTLEQELLDNPSSLLPFVLARFLPILVGLVLLVLAYIKRDKIKGGLIAPPPVAEPTLLFQPTPAFLLAIGGFYVIPSLVGEVLAQMAGVEPAALPLGQKLLSTALGSLPVALIVLHRRRRMVRLSAPEREVLLGRGAPSPTRPPGWRGALGTGLWVLCVATVIITPLAAVWKLVLDALGNAPQAQELVTKVVYSASHTEPWLIAGFGVLVAPFVEECLFRGLLYPATKRAFGGGRTGAWSAAILVSLVFAGVHRNWLALVPLFALAMCLTWIMERRNSLAAAVITHATYNALSLLPLMVHRYTT